MSAVEAERTLGVREALPLGEPTRFDPTPADVLPSPASIRRRKRPEPRSLAQIAMDFSCFVVSCCFAGWLLGGSLGWLVA